jgi:hypothetical protein
MDEIKIGSRVKNISITWCSGYFRNPSTGEIQFLPLSLYTVTEKSKFRSLGYVECSDDTKRLGTVVDIRFHKSSPVYLVRWDNDSFCGKMSGQIELSIEDIRDNKLSELGI